MAYPLVNVHITMENHHFQWENPLFQWSFSSSQTVSLPEGNNHGNKAMMIYPRCSESYVWDTNDSARLSFGI